MVPGPMISGRNNKTSVTRFFCVSLTTRNGSIFTETRNDELE